MPLKLLAEITIFITAANHCCKNRNDHHMTFKQFVKATCTPNDNKSADKAKVEPAANQPATPLDKASDDVGPPAPKSS
jgi:hypothetical protein